MNFQNYLLDEQVLRPEWVPQMKAEFTAQIEAEIEKVFSEPDIIPNIETELADMYKPHNFTTFQPSNITILPHENSIRYTRDRQRAH